jgi:hypothetical protein
MSKFFTQRHISVTTHQKDVLRLTFHSERFQRSIGSKKMHLCLIQAHYFLGPTEDTTKIPPSSAPGNDFHSPSPKQKPVFTRAPDEADGRRVLALLAQRYTFGMGSSVNLILPAPPFTI